jgi:hypothetical protein
VLGTVLEMNDFGKETESDKDGNATSSDEDIVTCCSQFGCLRPWAFRLSEN